MLVIGTDQRGTLLQEGELYIGYTVCSTAIELKYRYAQEVFCSVNLCETFYHQHSLVLMHFLMNRLKFLNLIRKCPMQKEDRPYLNLAVKTIWASCRGVLVVPL